ncbi:MAG: nucleotidyltransferase domain-containing protein [Chloroflexi bacterium]|jgi:predicted nucleotidyltransferase|nr:nucleotidyltransferase domain-containing protein [Chloroflexota bacterium]
MVDKTILKTIREYLQILSSKGVPVKVGVLFGSYATGKTHKWSDIDLLVISPRFDKKLKRTDIDLLWHVAADVDSRIEPIAVGERQFKEDNSSFIIEIARREGQIIPLAE